MKRRWMLLAIALAALGCKGPNHMGKLGAGGAPPAYNLPPPVQLMHPGPGVDGPGPGVLQPPPLQPPPHRTSQVWFVGPDGMYITWDVSAPGAFDSEPLIAPGRYNFPQGAIYRLKLTNTGVNRPGVELYPTLEIGPTLPRTEAYLAHNPIPVQFTEEDFEQVLSGNFVTKVIYLPDAEYQELAVAGVEVLVSSRLDPGQDPIVEADRRGAIMAVVRMGNIDLQAPGVAVGGVDPASYNAPIGPPGYNGLPPQMGYAPQAMAPGYISGVTMPEYGMPITGTPIGIPGPPHIPLGGPAGLQSHTIYNHTPVCMPPPTPSMHMHVRQDPGLSYPQPASSVFIHEKVYPDPRAGYGPAGAQRQGGYCPPQ
jgi:hypothetical protein